MKPGIALVGAVEAPSVGLGTLSPVGLMAEAAAHALRGTDLVMSDVDGLFSASPVYHMPTVTLAEYLGIRPRYSDSTTIGGSSFVAHVRHAAGAIRSGLCSVALIAYASTQRSDGSRYVGSASELSPYEAPFGIRWPLTGYAMRARRHIHEFGTTSEQLATVAVAAREWSLLNPRAPHRTPLTVDDVLSSPLVCAPLHRLDCCLVTDAAGAVVIVSEDRAADVAPCPVTVLGAAEAHDARYISGIPDFTATPATVTGAAALKEASMTLSDIDVVEMYDAFTISVILALEDLGFCEKGMGGPFAASGVLRPGGGLPMNTNGGGLSYRHGGMLGINLLIEAFEQLTGTAGQRQVEGVSTALVHALGGVQTTAATLVLGRMGAV